MNRYRGSYLRRQGESSSSKVSFGFGFASKLSARHFGGERATGTALHTNPVVVAADSRSQKKSSRHTSQADRLLRTEPRPRSKVESGAVITHTEPAAADASGPLKNSQGRQAIAESGDVRRHRGNRPLTPDSWRSKG